MHLLITFAVGILIALWMPAGALANTQFAADRAFTAMTVADRTAALAELEAAAGEPLADYAAGSIRFFVALEMLGQGLHRHGFESPTSFIMPLMRLPIPDNRRPEALDYEKFRAILVDFRDELEASAAILARVPDDADIGLVVDLARLGIDIDGDGRIAPGYESATAIIAAIATGGQMDPGEAPDLTFRFDRADGYWLQGYANFLMAQADFWLAHDFRNAFDGSFHMLFPRAKLPLQDALVPRGFGDGSILASEWRIADLISLIHYVNWPVVEPERRRAARGHLIEMIRLSRENWRAILAETDNDREWLPGPHQPGIHVLTGLEVGEEEVRGWMIALTMAEDLLEGRALLPHIRITGQGIDMKRFFEDPHTFDLVPMITGPGAVPYLARGRILTAEEFDLVQSQFGGAGFMTFALWFN
jgi:hypothetical protein